MDQMFKISVGDNSDLGRVKNKEVTWDGLVKALTHHRKGKKEGRFIVGGQFQDSERVDEKMTSRSLITIDIDDPGMSLNDLEELLAFNIDCAFIAHSTYRHTPEHPRVRVVIPLSREVTPIQYRQIAKQFSEDLGVDVDDCSHKPNQFMWLPSSPEDGEPWSYVQDGEPLEVGSHIELVKDEEPDDLEQQVAAQPIDVTVEEVKAYLDAYPAEPLDYDGWIEVAEALNHQFQGSDEGYELWLEWSRRSSKHDERQMLKKYKSFGRKGRTTKPLTFASIIYHVNRSGNSLLSLPAKGSSEAQGELVESQESAFDELLSEAAAVESMQEYEAFKRKVKAYSQVILPDDLRAMIAGELALNFGKGAGKNISKTDIKKALMPSRKERQLETGGNVRKPEWLENWCYVEMTCEFANSELSYSIKREAFNAKFDRMPEAIMAEKQASNFALNDCHLKTVVDTMFWPGVDKFFERDGKEFLNSYRVQGAEVADTISDEGKRTIDMLLDHVAFTVEDPREQRILLDWIAYVYQNPGKRINWALLLQGAQGVGKSYFVELMQHLMGDLVRNLDPTAITGRFTGWAHGSLVTAIEEIRVSGTSKYETLDRMKPFITNSTVQIEEKGRDHRTVPNFTSYFLLTNHRDAIPLTEGDRRYCVLFSRVQSEQQLFEEKGGEDGAAAYFDELFSMTERHASELALWFRDYKVSSDFDPKGRAPETKARELMRAVSLSPERASVEDALENYKCAVINEELVDVTWLNHVAVTEGDFDLPKTRALSAILLEMGYSPIKGRRVKIKATDKLHYVWTRGDSETAKQAVKSFHNDDENPPF